MRATYDVAIVGGGHNGLTAAAYLARAGRSVVVLERLGHVGGAAVSSRVFAGLDARVSRYSYLVSLLPRAIIAELGLQFATIPRRISSVTPYDDGRRALVMDRIDHARTASSFRELTGSDDELAAWERFYAMTARLAGLVFPTLTEPLRSRRAFERLIEDRATWEALFERPLGDTIERELSHDITRGVALTDGLIGTFASSADTSLAQNRCFLYHVIGNGTGDWDVPKGGMGALPDALAACARASGAEILTSADVTAVHADELSCEIEVNVEGINRRIGAGHVLAGCAPRELGRLRGLAADPLRPEGAQLKVNMLLERLPALRCGIDPRDAFAGTLHIAESYEELERAHREAAAGQIPSRPPSEVYCHTLTDPSILGDDLRRRGCHTLTLFGLHMPARLFTHDNAGVRSAALDRTLAVLNEQLAEPIEDLLMCGPSGAPCIEVRSPLDIEDDVGLPGGNIFQRELQWPFAERDDEVGTWGVETDHPRVLLCGAGARRGGGVSGIPGHNAARVVLMRPDERVTPAVRVG